MNQEIDPPLARRPTDFSPERMARFILTHCWIVGFSQTTDLSRLPNFCKQRLAGLESLRVEIHGAAIDLDNRWHLIGTGYGVCSHVNHHAHGRVLRHPLVDATTVPKESRHNPYWVRWPRYLGTGVKHLPLLLDLTERLGEQCSVCHAVPWQVVDHDHLSGMVRGLLCYDCNNQVDHCRHLNFCPYADYLNDPPAGALQCHYPPHTKIMRQPRKQQRQEVWKHVMNGGTSPGLHGAAARRTVEPVQWYTVLTHRDGQWWIAEIPELDGLTQGRTSAHAIEMAREWIALALDRPIETIRVRVNPHGP